MMPRIIVKALRKRNETGLARIIHEGFYSNRRYVAATSLTAGGSPLGRSTHCFKYTFLPHGSARPSRLPSRRFRQEPS
jgi:hypothetical protein